MPDLGPVTTAIRTQLGGVEETPGATKPDPILVVDNIVRRWPPGMTSVDVAAHRRWHGLCDRRGWNLSI